MTMSVATASVMTFTDLLVHVCFIRFMYNVMCMPLQPSHPHIITPSPPSHPHHCHTLPTITPSPPSQAIHEDLINGFRNCMQKQIQLSKEKVSPAHFYTYIHTCIYIRTVHSYYSVCLLFLVSHTRKYFFYKNQKCTIKFGQVSS